MKVSSRCIGGEKGGWRVAAKQSREENNVRREYTERSTSATVGVRLIKPGFMEELHFHGIDFRVRRQDSGNATEIRSLLGKQSLRRPA